MKKVLVLACLFGSLWAHGEAYCYGKLAGITSDRIYLRTPRGLYSAPLKDVTFRLEGVSVGLNALAHGRTVTAYAPDFSREKTIPLPFLRSAYIDPARHKPKTP